MYTIMYIIIYNYIIAIAEENFLHCGESNKTGGLS